ncbi:Hsp70 nucleotide exchange factor FES1 [Cytospora mali]|uniref:Hsp70 nucleotide exchange factor FES1 n=1 Tax=Cytospora mali TaxID=578113 RepID=A0A194VF21_CYTMA|nr:Hsp70 nucleotide exchange factor FES1 [Valsa mali var. pyri (nom. inval.)]
MDKNLSQLLKWSIEAQTSGTSNDSTNTNTNNNNSDGQAPAPAPAPAPRSDLTPEILSSILGGPSDAELMQQSMAVITSADPEVSLEHKLVAFDNFEQLIESLDNANNIANLALWTPLLQQLSHEESEMRKYAAWCVGTAVQNNEKSQERLLAAGGLPSLVKVVLNDDEAVDVRRKAVYALSSATRNYQPAMDVVTAELEKGGHIKEGTGKVDATNMDAVDVVMDGLKELVKQKASA